MELSRETVDCGVVSKKPSIVELSREIVEYHGFTRRGERPIADSNSGKFGICFQITEGTFDDWGF